MSTAGAALGRPIKGPSALGGDVRRLLHLSGTLAVMEFKLRFFGSVLGYLWQLMRPLLLFGVLYAVFTQFVKLGAGIQYYPAILLTGIVLFTFFSDATARSVTAVLDRENLVRKIEFPRLVVPIAVILLAYFNLVLNLLAVLVFVLLTGVDVRVEWLALPLLLIPLGMFASGLAMLLSALYVRFRDVQPIWEVLLQLLFYGSPVIYVITTVPESFRQVAMFNPMAAILTQWRHAVIDQSAPTAGTAIGGIELLVVPVAIVIAIFALGLWVFMRETPRIAENL
jgi:ABC-2 type transport system permease protein